MDVDDTVDNNRPQVDPAFPTIPLILLSRVVGILLQLYMVFLPDRLHRFSLT